MRPSFRQFRYWLLDKRGISSVEYALLLSVIAGGILVSVQMLATATSSQIFEAASWLEGGADDCDNNGLGEGWGGGQGSGDGQGSGQGEGNTC